MVFRVVMKHFVVSDALSYSGGPALAECAEAAMELANIAASEFLGGSRSY